MTTRKIHIQLFDGTKVWVPINAKQIQDSRFEIVEDKEYENLNANELFEFFPGDIVELEEHVFGDGTKGQVAKKLISKGKWTDRDFNEFKFKVIAGQIKLDKETAILNREHIERVKKENLEGQFYYPSIIETVNKLESFLKDIKTEF